MWQNKNYGSVETCHNFLLEITALNISGYTAILCEIIIMHCDNIVIYKILTSPQICSDKVSYYHLCALSVAVVHMQDTPSSSSAVACSVRTDKISIHGKSFQMFCC